MKIAVVSVTKDGEKIADKLREEMSLDFYSKEEVKKEGIYSLSRNLIENYDSIIYISSTGIAVRAIAPFIKSKDKDPAVVVVDSNGKFSISLLSGHLGGGNELALKVAAIIKAEPVITTATDGLGKVAPDLIAKKYGLVIEDLKKAKEIAVMLVENKKVAFIDKKDLIEIPVGYRSFTEDCEGIVCVTNKIKENFILNGTSLRLIRKNIVLGIGCKRNYPSLELKENVLKLLKESNIDFRAVKAITTVEIKKNEKAILDLVEDFKCDFKIFSIEDIKRVQHKYKGSDFVEKAIGVRVVSEACAELYGGEIISDRLSLSGMTLCIGEL